MMSSGLSGIEFEELKCIEDSMCYKMKTRLWPSITGNKYWLHYGKCRIQCFGSLTFSSFLKVLWGHSQDVGNHSTGHFRTDFGCVKLNWELYISSVKPTLNKSLTQQHKHIGSRMERLCSELAFGVWESYIKHVLAEALSALTTPQWVNEHLADYHLNKDEQRCVPTAASI